jgi:hypothetical protein
MKKEIPLKRSSVIPLCRAIARDTSEKSVIASTSLYQSRFEWWRIEKAGDCGCFSTSSTMNNRDQL